MRIFGENVHACYLQFWMIRVNKLYFYVTCCFIDYVLCKLHHSVLTLAPSYPVSPPTHHLDITDEMEDVADSTKAAATITGALLGFKVLGPIGALAGATFANHYGERGSCLCVYVASHTAFSAAVVGFSTSYSS